MIDAYVREELSPADRSQFEARFLSSPQRRSKVEFARALRRVAAESGASPVAVERPSMRQAFLDMLRAFHPAMQFAAQWLCSFYWRAPPGSRFRIGPCVRGWQCWTRNGGRRKAEKQRFGGNLRKSRLARRMRRRNRKDRRPRAEATPLVASLVFLPNISRAAGNVQQLALSSRSQLARLEIQLEPRDDFPNFRAELHTRSGEEVLTRANLTRRRTSGGYAVAFDVPASALGAGEYELALKGVAGDQTTDIGYYYFRVRLQ